MCIALSVFVSIVCARDVVMQGTCLTLVSRVTILPECMCSRALRREGDIAGNIADIMAVASTYALVRAKRRRRVP